MHAHLSQGRLEPKALIRRDLSKGEFTDAVESLQSVGPSNLRSMLTALEPTAGQYAMLKNQLKAWRDSVIDDSTSRAVLMKLVLNMERWRWEPPWPERYIVVNIPAFYLHVIEKDSVWLSTPVVVGKRKTPTPVMESVVRSFTIYPYWHVPKSISTGEILPQLQRDPEYLGRGNFQVLNRKGEVIESDTIHWERYNADHFPFVLRQREGSENSMGIIKFNFSNAYNVYLHDTNSKALYRRAKRDLSHGCVRVQRAVSLAHYLVREDEIYVSPEDLDQYLMLQRRLDIKLRKPIPLKLKYFTAEVREGKAFFYDDIYKMDSIMAQRLGMGSAIVEEGKVLY